MDLMKQEMKSDAADNGKGSASCNPSSSSSKQLKACSDCHTTQTPLWRGGPEGPKSLCNACGIKYNKKRREILGLGRKEKEKEKKKKKKQSMIEESSRERVKLMALGLRRSGKLLGNLKEEEQAAILLMALSCGGSVYV